MWALRFIERVGFRGYSRIIFSIMRETALAGTQRHEEHPVVRSGED
jgi:hypothetical protein